MTTSSASAASIANPSPLPPRYVIRQLTSSDQDAATAIIVHSNMYHSLLLTVVLKPNAELSMTLFEHFHYLVQHQIDSGLSYGVFDTEYVYKRAESAATQGKLYWDESNTAADGPTLLQQMDFPLVSIALSYDQIDPLDMSQMTPLIQTLPLFGLVYGTLAAGDKRKPTDWSATAAGQVLMRNGTSTRADYEGKGIMKGLAHWLMREAKARGYRGIQIECVHDAVTHTWLHPPAPFVGELVSSFDTATFEQDGPNGEKVNPFTPAKVQVTKVYVTL